jgi:hypothetical protein
VAHAIRGRFSPSAARAGTFTFAQTSVDWASVQDRGGPVPPPAHPDEVARARGGRASLRGAGSRARFDEAEGGALRVFAHRHAAAVRVARIEARARSTTRLGSRRSEGIAPIPLRLSTIGAAKVDDSGHTRC